MLRRCLAIPLAALVLTGAGCGGDEDQAQAPQQAATPAPPPATTTPAPPSTTSASTATAPAATVTTPARPGAGPLRFTGTGTKKLGDFTVPRDATLRWTSDGPAFAVSDAKLRINLSSGGHSGMLRIKAGRYRKVEVDAAGRWTIAIAPRG